MATSQNGWTVLKEAPPRTTIPGTDIRLAILPGDVAFLLARVAGWFHANIERLDMPVPEPPGVDDWGYAYRPIRGKTTGFSNHASATAVDLNATQHPRGVKGTFSREEKALMHKHLAQYLDTVTDRVVIRWGEDYSGTIDGMHFEINADAAAVSRVAARLRTQDAKAAAAREEQDMPTADEIAKAVAGYQTTLMPYVKNGLPGKDGKPDPDGKKSLEELVQHSAGQSAAALKEARAATAIAQRNEAALAEIKGMLAMLAKMVTPAPEPTKETP